jgi:hypothetical protein
MRVLIGCEKSSRVRDAFIAKGHDAWSCDLEPSDVGGNHHQCDVLTLLDQDWDLGIFHPTCKYLSVSGIHWNNRGRGWDETEQALDFVRALMAAPIPQIAIENPVSIISSRIRKPDQIINPMMFGDDASKKTCLWLKNLPLLVVDPAMRFPGRMVEWPVGSGKMVERWANQTDSGQNKLPPSAKRAELRAVTYHGIAKAFAENWG